MLAYRCDNTNHVGSSSEGQIEHSACMLFGVGWVDWWGQAIRLNLFRPSRDGMGGGGAICMYGAQHRAVRMYSTVHPADDSSLPLTSSLGIR